MVFPAELGIQFGHFPLPRAVNVWPVFGVGAGTWMGVAGGDACLSACGVDSRQEGFAEVVPLLFCDYITGCVTE